MREPIITPSVLGISEQSGGNSINRSGRHKHTRQDIPFPTLAFPWVACPALNGGANHSVPQSPQQSVQRVAAFKAGQYRDAVYGWCTNETSSDCGWNVSRSIWWLRGPAQTGETQGITVAGVSSTAYQDEGLDDVN
jgi:hypothetical protein